jgi:hypothetical protein
MTFKFTFLVLTLALTSQPVMASEPWPSFDEVRSRYRDTNDMGRVSYLYRRCAALQLNVAALLARRKQSDMAKKYESLANNYMILSERVDIQLDRKQGNKSRNTMETVSLAVKYMSSTYSQRMNDNQLKRGSHFSGDPVLEAELAECVDVDQFVKNLQN